MGSLPPQEPFDILIIGAGLSGIYSLINYRKRFPDWRIKVIEAAPDVGGTWYYNCYPGCRFDSETLSYCYSFDKEMLDEWNWKETFSAQPETEEYIQRVVEKHDCRKDMQFNTRIKSAHWDDQSRTWTFVDETGDHHTTRFLVSCVGVLSKPTLPAIPGVESFQGESFHTSRWPKDFDINRDLTNKSIGVIGTGATGIQVITAISKVADIKSLSVFQRTATWSAPLRNEAITPEDMASYKAQYPTIFQRCRDTPTGFLHKPDPRNSLDVSHSDRLALWDQMYARPGFGKWLGVFKDTYTSRPANELYSAYMASKIRARVHDPAVAEALVPKNHGFGTRRVPLESGYFEAYNQPHVHLVDLQRTPITRVTATGVETADGVHHDLDVLVHATGFDAITGALAAIEWHAKDDRPLVSATEEGRRCAIWPHHRPATFLGMMAPALPNVFMVLGPHQPFGNIPRSIENAVEVISDMLQFFKDNGITYVEPRQEAVERWTAHVVECSKGALVNEVDSWMTGVNSNVEGKNVRTVARYSGATQEFRRWCEESKKSGYKDLILE